MSELILIRKPSPHHHDPSPQGHHHRHVVLKAARSTLAKRRWRGEAEDGQEFGFDLEEPLTHGTSFYQLGSTFYHLEQLPEEVLEIPITTAESAAKIAWTVGNLHFPIQVLPHALRVMEDSAIIQLLQREEISFQRLHTVFLPLSSGGGHHHHHSHEPHPHHG